MTSKRTLIVDDEPDIRELLEITLGRMGIETEAAENVSQALQFLAGQTFDLCLTDMQLPDGNGLEIIAHINEHLPQLPVAMITAFGSMDTAISALKAGAFDFVQKPIDLDQLRSLVESALKLSGPATDDRVGVQLIGSSTSIIELRAKIAKLARSQAPIYIAGESGSGKEVAARMIHALGPRGESPFIAVNCGAIPSELMESEFFGHVKGSFTGAIVDKEGLFQAASGGTLLLDEVADLPLSMQVKLLRAIQEKAVRPVGAQREDTTDVRILSATHKSLADEVDTGNFRQDLYYRLNVIELPIPALRDHALDVPELAERALARLAREYGGDTPNLSPQANEALQRYDFPGNVRELENILERAFTLSENNEIQPEDLQLRGASTAQNSSSPIEREHLPSLPDSTPDSTEQAAGTTEQAAGATSPASTNQDVPYAALPDGQNLEDFLEQIERRIINQALAATRWNKTAAAKALGITFRALRYKLKKLDLE